MFPRSRTANNDTNKIFKTNKNNYNNKISIKSMYKVLELNHSYYFIRCSFKSFSNTPNETVKHMVGNLRPTESLEISDSPLYLTHKVFYQSCGQ